MALFFLPQGRLTVAITMETIRDIAALAAGIAAVLTAVALVMNAWFNGRQLKTIHLAVNRNYLKLESQLRASRSQIIRLRTSGKITAAKTRQQRKRTTPSRGR